MEIEVVWRVAESQQSFSTEHTLEEVEVLLRSRVRNANIMVVGRHPLSDFVNDDMKSGRIQNPEEAFVRSVTEAGFINSQTSESKVNLIQDELLTMLRQNASDGSLGIEIEQVIIKQIRFSEEIL